MAAATDAVLTEYAALAPDYDRRWRRYVERSIRETLRRAAVRPGERVLDVGCGTGTMLLSLAQDCAGVFLSGVDPSPPMLQVARSKLPRDVGLCVAAAENLPFPDAAFDAVICTSVFHYIKPEPALAEARRVLVPGGRVIITDWCDDFFWCRVCGVWLRWTGRPFSRIYRGSECAAELAAAGFVNVEIDRYKVSRLWGMMTARGVRPG